MAEDHLESQQGRSLHVYPPPNEFTHTTNEYYTLSNLKKKKKSCFKWKFNIKKKLKRQLISRKFPRSTREHTEFDKYRYETTCPNCLSYIRTKIYHYNTGVTHAVAATFTPICMCMVPYLINRYKNTAHYCPRCKIYLGTKYGAGRNIFSHCITT